MFCGKVDYFLDAKGYGFLRSPEHVLPIFVHWSAVQFGVHKTLEPESQVYFDVIPGRIGLRAIHVCNSDYFKERCLLGASLEGKPVKKLLKHAEFTAQIKDAFRQIPFQTDATWDWFASQL